MTEEEAKAKVCPQTFANVDQYDVHGRHIQSGGPWRCVGSECMAWRWVPAAKSQLFAAASEKRAREVGYLDRPDAQKREVAYRNPPPGVNYDEHDGYCGLAGVPQ